MLFELQFFPVNLFITLVTYKCLELNQITKNINKNKVFKKDWTQQDKKLLNSDQKCLQITFHVHLHLSVNYRLIRCWSFPAKQPTNTPLG